MTQPATTPEATIESRLSAFLSEDEAPPASEAGPPEKEAHATEADASEEASGASESESPEAPASESGSDDATPAARDDASASPDDDGEGEAEAVNTLAELATLLEVPLEDFTAHIQVDGPNGDPIPLSQVLEAHKNAPETAKLARETSEKAAKIQAREAEIDAEADKRLGVLAALANRLIGQIENEKQYTQEEIAALEADDPLAAVQIRTKQQERQQAVRDSLDAMHQESEKRTAEQTKLQEQWIETEATALLEARPEWAEGETLTKVRDRVEKYLKARGFLDEDLGMMVDHRYMLVAADAAELAELKLKQKLAGAKVRQTPKTILPGQARRDASADSARKKSEALRRRLRTSGSARDAGRAIEELL